LTVKFWVRIMIKKFCSRQNFPALHYAFDLARARVPDGKVRRRNTNVKVNKSGCGKHIVDTCVIPKLASAREARYDKPSRFRVTLRGKLQE